MVTPGYEFPRRYTAADVAVLAEMDALHGTLSGPATKKLMERACHVFGDRRYERLARISVAHLYNLRGRDTVPAHASALDQDAAHRHAHRPTPRARTERPTRLSSASTACIRAIRTG